MRLLFLLPHVPAREAFSGGARSTAHLIAGLGVEHEIAVLCLRRSNDAPTDDALRSACEVFETIDAPADTRAGSESLRVPLTRIARLFGPPQWVRSTNVDAYRVRLRTMLRDWQPDIVHIGYQVMGQYAPELASCAAPRVLTVYDPRGGPPPGIEAVANLQTRWRERVDGRAWARFERRVFRMVDVVVALTERDRAAVASLAGGTPIVRIPLGVPIPARPLNPRGSAPQIVFVGNFVHHPNVDAAVWLLRTIFPLVRKARPDARLLIAGPGAPEVVRHSRSDAVTVMGPVDDLEPVLDGAAIVVAPLRLGGGMRVKVMEALARGKAVVSSHLAAEGLGVSDGQQLLLADEPERVAACVIGLLDDPDARVALASRAREWAEANLGWERSIEAYNRLQETLLSSSDPPSSRAPKHSRRLHPLHRAV